MGRRKDYWPQHKAHVLLGVPGSAERTKGYWEPGVAASVLVLAVSGQPALAGWTRSAAKSARPAIWCCITIPARNAHQLLFPEPGGLTGIKIEVWAYDATWRCEKPNEWSLTW
ncbi:MAG: hypothetical protein U0Y68_10375 [Blastocatellia bacterium]